METTIQKYWAVLGCTGLYLATLGLTRPYWALLGLNRPYFAFGDSLTDERTLRLKVSKAQ